MVYQEAVLPGGFRSWGVSHPTCGENLGRAAKGGRLALRQMSSLTRCFYWGDVGRLPPSSGSQMRCPHSGVETPTPSPFPSPRRQTGHFPWGIETHSKFPRHKRPPQSRQTGHFPWGIETQITHIVCSDNATSADRTLPVGN